MSKYDQGYKDGLEKGKRLGLMKSLAQKTDRIKELENEVSQLNEELEEAQKEISELEAQLESYREVLFFDIE